jgi:lysozyme
MTLSELSKMALTLIEHHKGRRAFSYYDSVGKISIGIGRKLADRGLSDNEISLLLLNDMRLSRKICQQLLVNFDSIAPTRQAALLSMAFNLGAPRSGKFHNMRAAIAADEWRLAAALCSKWTRQLPARAAEIAALLRG